MALARVNDAAPVAYENACSVVIANPRSLHPPVQSEARGSHSQS